MRINVIVVTLASIIAAIGLFVLAYVQGASNLAESDRFADQVKSCELSALRLTIDVGKPTVQNLSNISVYCYNDVRRLQLLSASIINRGNYVHQRFENNIILVMVVIITCSGVALAGLQLLTSYQLAVMSGIDTNSGSELVIERGKLSLRSSVTGILVLGLSLAFFFVYVLWVYTIRETKIENVIEVEQAVPLVPNSSGPTSFPAGTPSLYMGHNLQENAISPLRVVGRTKISRIKLLPGGFGPPPKDLDAKQLAPPIERKSLRTSNVRSPASKLIG